MDGVSEPISDSWDLKLLLFILVVWKKRKKRKIMECFCLVTIGRHCDILIEETLCNDVAIPGRLRNQRKLVSWLIMAGYHHVLACAKGEKMWARYNERAACEHLPKALHAINYVWSIWIVKKYLPGTELFHVKLLHFHPLFMTSLYNTFCNISVRHKKICEKCLDDNGIWRKYSVDLT